MSMSGPTKYTVFLDALVDKVRVPLDEQVKEQDAVEPPEHDEPSGHLPGNVRPTLQQSPCWVRRGPTFSTMRKPLRVSVLAALFLLPACGSDALPPELPLVVTETSAQGTVQVTIDPEGTVFTGAGGETTRQEVADDEIVELRGLMADADLGDLDGASTANPRYIILAGDVEIFLGPGDVPQQLVPLLDWIDAHRG